MKILFWTLSGALMLISGMLDFKFFGEFVYLGPFTPICIISATIITVLWAKFYPKSESDSNSLKSFLENL